jgi:hypothetical protein
MAGPDVAPGSYVSPPPQKPTPDYSTNEYPTAVNPATMPPASPAPKNNPGQTAPASAYLSGEAQGMPATVDPDVLNLANWGSSKYGVSESPYYKNAKIEPEDLLKAPGAQNLSPLQLSQAAAMATDQMKATQASRSVAGKAIQEPLTLPGAAPFGKLPYRIPGKNQVEDYGDIAGTSYDPRRLGLAKTTPSAWIDTTDFKSQGKPAPAPSPKPTGDNRPSMGDGMYDSGLSKSENWRPADLPHGQRPTPPNVNPSPEDIKNAAGSLTNDEWGKFGGGLLDVIGAGKAAYAGQPRKTMLQQEFANKLQIEQQKQQAMNKAKATISTLEPKAAAQIEQIRAEYEASGDKDVYVSKLNQARNLGLIDESKYTNLLNAAVSPASMIGGGKNAAVDDLRAPGEMP